MNTDLALLSAAELRHLYRNRQLSPVETTRAVLERIDRLDSQVNAFCLVDGERALAAARASEARWHTGEPCGMVDGVPATIKDVVLTRDWATLAAASRSTATSRGRRTPRRRHACASRARC